MSVHGLYGRNTPASFWQTGSAVSEEQWESAAAAAVGVLPGGPEVLAEQGWDGLMQHILGEGQFGPRHYRLGGGKRLYYFLKPLLPREARLLARFGYHKLLRSTDVLHWPIDDRYVRFLYAMRERVDCTSSGTRPCGVAFDTAPDGFWPDGARYSFVITHDVERASGQAFARKLADVDERYGFRSAFNFVAEDYSVDESLFTELRDRGFEIGLHGLKHDGKLFWSRVAFDTSASRINRYLREWAITGFRAPLTQRNPEWLQALDIEYDSSFFDTDPYEVMPGGTMSIWPFFCGRFVELPYTLAQDHTLIVILRQRTPRLWIEKVDFIERWGGMALVNVHPDYMRNPANLAVYEEFLQEMASRRAHAQTDIPLKGAPGFWHALPRDAARWWNDRSDGVVHARQDSTAQAPSRLRAERGPAA